MPFCIALVSEDSQAQEQLARSIGLDPAELRAFATVEEVVSSLSDPLCSTAIVIFDVTMRRRRDFDALQNLFSTHPQLHLLLLSPDSHPSHEELLAKSRRFYVLPDPLLHRKSLTLIREVVNVARAEGEERQILSPEMSSDDILNYSEPFLSRVGMADVPVLLQGETGVGKEVMARRLCAYSPRANKPFLKLNCAALPSELIESELFGYEKGAFTGATMDKPGKFEIAKGGTILLDEIGDMDIRLQAELLHVLQDGEIQPLGSNRIVKVNVRVMAATHRDLRQAIKEGTFREDLYYRLNVINIVISPLRERRTEILPLAESLLRRHVLPGSRIPAISSELKTAMLEHDWPGNVRELENFIRRFLVYQNTEMLIAELKSQAASRIKPKGVAKPADLHLATSGQVLTIDRLAEVSREAEAKLLLDALEATHWNRRQAAARLNIDYKAFLYKLQKCGIVEMKAKRANVSAWPNG